MEITGFEGMKVKKYFFKLIIFKSGLPVWSDEESVELCPVVKIITSAFDSSEILRTESSSEREWSECLCDFDPFFPWLRLPILPQAVAFALRFGSI